MANDNGFVSIAGVTMEVTEEIIIISTTELFYSRVQHLSFYLAAQDWRGIDGRDGAKQHSRQIRSMCTEKRNYCRTLTKGKTGRFARQSFSFTGQVNLIPVWLW